MTTVTAVTRNAGQDDLTAADYRDIYDELRGYDVEAGKYAIALRPFVELINSAVTGAMWSKYHNGKADLNRAMRNELRAAVGRQPLPPTVAEAVAIASPDAAVVQVGVSRPDRLIMVGEDVQRTTIYVNGDVTAGDGNPESDATTVTRPARSRTPRKQVQVSSVTHRRLLRLRDDGGYRSIEAAVMALLAES